MFGISLVACKLTRATEIASERGVPLSMPPFENLMLSKYRRNSKGLNVGLDVFIEFNAPPNSSLALNRTFELA